MKVVIASICLEKKGKPDLMLNALRFLADHNYSVCITDGGSSLEFVEKIAAMGHDISVSAKGLRGQMESSLLRAADKGDAVFYCEIDKVEFLTTRLQQAIVKYKQNDLDYAVIGRSKKEFMSFPLAQREIETAENNLISAELNQVGDWVGGPAIMPSSLIKTLQASQLFGTHQNGWGVPWYLLGRAKYKNLKIGTIELGCGVHPSAVNEFNPGYRLYQANQILGCFYEGIGKDYDWQ
jgi:hypothetical protein